MAIRILVDSTSDILPAEATELNVIVVPLKTVFGDVSFRENIDISHGEFFEKLATVKDLPTTSQPTPADFLPHFEAAKEAGDDVICLMLAGTLSGTLQSAEIAKGMCEYDRIFIVDTLSAIIGTRLLVNLAMEMRAANNTAEEIVEAVEEAKGRIELFAMVDTLEYLHKGGRLSKTSKILGGFLKMKPLITLKDGQLQVLGKARGVDAAMDTLLELIGDTPDVDKSVPVVYGYTLNDTQCAAFREKADTKYGFENTIMYSVGSVIGTHIGPHAFVIGYLKNKPA